MSCEAARDVDELLREPDLSSFTTSLLSLVNAGSAVANPAYAAGIAMGKFVAQASARRLMKKGDRELGAVVTSFVRPEHYPQGIRESHEIVDMTSNMFYDYIIFGHKRAEAVTEKLAPKPKRKRKRKRKL